MSSRGFLSITAAMLLACGSARTLNEFGNPATLQPSATAQWYAINCSGITVSSGCSGSSGSSIATKRTSTASPKAKPSCLWMVLTRLRIPVFA